MLCCILPFLSLVRCLDDHGSTQSRAFMREYVHLRVAYLTLVSNIVHALNEISDKSNNTEIKSHNYTRRFFENSNPTPYYITNEGPLSTAFYPPSKLRLSSFNSSLERAEAASEQQQQRQPRGKSCENGREQREEGRKELSGSIQGEISSATHTYTQTHTEGLSSPKL